MTLFPRFLSNLEEFQEAGFGGARLPHHGHRSAEVVHVLTVGIQHHGLRELLRNIVVSHIKAFIRIFFKNVFLKKTFICGNSHYIPTAIIKSNAIYIHTTVQKFGVIQTILCLPWKLIFIYQINWKLNRKYSQDIDKVRNND